MTAIGTSMTAFDRVLLQIARCPTSIPASAPHAPVEACRHVVAAQGPRQLAHFQVPEPWRGDLANAPLLFVSSNPGWDPQDDSPTADRSDAELVKYFTKDGFPPEFPRNRRKNGQPNQRAVAFWASIRKRAAELYELPPEKIVAGSHFALTEVVHCKSAKESAAYTAASECARRHMGAIAGLSPAKAIVVFGSLAATALGVAEKPTVTARMWHGHQRLMAWLPHPNAHKQRTFKIYSEADLQLLRATLKKP